MKTFDSDLAEMLNACCDGSPIERVILGMHDFQLAFAGISRLQGTFKVVFRLRGHRYSWTGGPCDIPAWRLPGQVPIRFERVSAFVLRLCLASGDEVEFHTAENAYECVVIEFLRNGREVMEIA
ncbi:hypothetical protein L2U69_00820 [Zavarzinia compransoris]|uniref:hypothetical protein n=1 Tax=Zavarzinia marina TaxID=2911065 RepID=UPI001F2538AF|nr:hypothetical protein [Zavarzinia marina]MCF4164185.1 hypothetical protein [Zavarzinia marina]